jgi:hypothetical protein
MNGDAIIGPDGQTYEVVHDFAHHGKDDDLLNPVITERSPRLVEAERHIEHQTKPRPPGSGRRIRPKIVES